MEKDFCHFIARRSLTERETCSLLLRILERIINKPGCIWISGTGLAKFDFINIGSLPRLSKNIGTLTRRRYVFN